MCLLGCGILTAGRLIARLAKGIIAMALLGVNTAMAKHVKKTENRGRPSVSGQAGKTENRTLRVDALRWEAWRSAAAREQKTIAAWIRDTLDIAALELAGDSGEATSFHSLR